MARKGGGWSHEQFQARLHGESHTRFPSPAQALEPWERELHFVWHADLDFVGLILRLTYSTHIDRPLEHSPKDLLRCLLLCQDRGFRSLTLWHAQLRCEPVLLLLSGLFNGLFRRPSIVLFTASSIRCIPRVVSKWSSECACGQRRPVCRQRRWTGAEGTRSVGSPAAP